jgi:invasion associated locus B (IalB) protein
MAAFCPDSGLEGRALQAIAAVRRMAYGRDALPVVSGTGPGYGGRMRGDRPLQLSFAVGLLISIPTAGHAASLKSPSAAAQSRAGTPAEQLGSIAAWTAYAYSEKSGKVCYLAGQPARSQPAGAKRKRPVAMVTHRPGERIANVVSFIEGYPLQEGSDVSLHIDGTRFDLFTKGDGAWARTAELDKSIVEAMTRGKQAIVKGTPVKGPVTTDTYSLAGFAQAITLIDKACDVKR